jgi:hypothetical protein
MVHPLRSSLGMMRNQTNTTKRAGKKGEKFSLTKALLVALVLLVTLITSANAKADTYEFDNQLHMRFGVGLVGGGSLGESEKTSVSFSGPGVLDGVQIGGHAGNDISFFVEADSLILVSDNAGSKDETTLYGFLVGAGMGTHLSAANIYLSGTIGASVNNVELTRDGVTLDSQAVGFGLSVMVGKDWSVSNHWNIGLGGQFLCLVDYGVGGEAISSHTIAGGFLFTASFE